MGEMIAITGKGGVGKTAFTAVAVDTLVKRNWKPLLAVDADPNLNLDAALGVDAHTTVGGIREEVVEGEAQDTGGMSKAELLEYRIQMSLVESEGFDLIAMGRPEGPGCYCFANELMRNVLDSMIGRYRCVVVDCEAGLEHLSRRTTGDVDLFVALSDPTVRSLQTARRAIDLMDEVRTSAADIRVVVNRVRGDLEESIRQAAVELDLEIATCLPEDDQVRSLDAVGEPLTQLPDDSPFRQAVESFLTNCGFRDQDIT